MIENNHDPLQPHSHDPNPAPPSDDPSIATMRPDGTQQTVTVDALRALPQITLRDCYIVSTGHGTSGPFIFTGPSLRSVIEMCLSDKNGDEAWRELEVISGDGFGNRVQRQELANESIILACTIDGQPMTREQGLVRMIVPSETDDALRQVKWIGRINIL